jgi:hypothetical protein
MLCQSYKAGIERGACFCEFLRERGFVLILGLPGGLCAAWQRRRDGQDSSQRSGS